MSADDQRLLSNRQRLASELRRIRDRSGLSGRQLAEQVGISQSKVSRIESGRTVPSVPEVEAWATAVSAPETLKDLLTALTDASYTEVHPWTSVLQDKRHLQDEIQEIENRARLELEYEPSVVPGLLQTAEYARRVFTMFDPVYAEVDIPAVVASRLDRQVALFDPARRFAFLITEAALRWRPGPVPVLLSQLDRIASVSTLENVSIGLIPQAARALTQVPHGFVVVEPLDQDGDTLVMVETVHANLVISDPAQAALYRRHWSLLEKSAVFGGDARDLLAGVAADIRTLPHEDDS
jgi:transcriptional regulator with XRE-family HTH domain